MEVYLVKDIIYYPFGTFDGIVAARDKKEAYDIVYRHIKNNGFYYLEEHVRTYEQMEEDVAITKIRNLSYDSDVSALIHFFDYCE